MKLNLIRLGALATALMLGCTEAISLGNNMTPIITDLAQVRPYNKEEFHPNGELDRAKLDAYEIEVMKELKPVVGLLKTDLAQFNAN